MTPLPRPVGPWEAASSSGSRRRRGQVEQVVRGLSGKSTDAPVVLGIDVWDLPPAAIMFAFEKAARRRAPLHAVYAGRAAPGAVGDLLTPWRDKYPDVALTTEIADDSRAGPVLVAISMTAAMVVVGSHNRGELRSQLLGSVGYTLITKHAARSPSSTHPTTATEGSGS